MAIEHADKIEYKLFSKYSVQNQIHRRTLYTYRNSNTRFKHENIYNWSNSFQQQQKHQRVWFPHLNVSKRVLNNKNSLPPQGQKNSKVRVYK